MRRSIPGQSYGFTPLRVASEYGHADVVQLLLDYNADLDARDSDGDTLLHCAASGGQLEVARLLLKLNIEVNSRNNEGSTPLHLASAGIGIRWKETQMSFAFCWTTARTRMRETSMDRPHPR